MERSLENKLEDILKIMMREFDYKYDSLCPKCGKPLSFYSSDEIWECDYCGKEGSPGNPPVYELRKFKPIGVSSSKPSIKMEGILTHEEVGEILGATPRTLTIKLESGEIDLPFAEDHKGKKIYREDDVSQYMNSLFIKKE